MNNAKKTSQKDFIFGVQPVKEAFHNGDGLEKIFIQRNSQSKGLKDIIELAKKNSIPFSKVPIQKLNKFTSSNHQGVVALSSLINYINLENFLPSIFEQGKDPFLLILDRITDIRNFGALARVAECAGANGLVIPRHGGAIINHDAVKTSSGALNILPVCRETSLRASIQYLQKSGVSVIACSEKGEKNLYQLNHSGPTAIIAGSEEDGISTELMSQADYTAYIPMQGTINSLNVSVATGIAMFEILRQRQNHL